ncbi:CUN089 putative helicase-1, DNA replication, similar to AcMNPV ORF95 [Culex nigripalpus nucleopolyhedrovirus]|uniref:CUN089 putative helicase-1, DNA replication, similar to AcMNPV ORF95 n=1 Tax=Culex nigripalpus nucleopolyhedrovirus (isolate Florida/1997) TaxID=645993 RepID=Q919I6_NPVCO|nr:CUN089 putative helicase-1, DNA replication, similar to AcMNPV ORF95 [Culex nigripalpus nucleopolyhedrovirus]AAK94167.1 CUN089 putative helicase-1, DNA replication, similar to AcMNPV ORF95 [Culex nigripalpus nucleopolyhedrovirus]
MSNDTAATYSLDSLAKSKCDEQHAKDQHDQRQGFEHFFHSLGPYDESEGGRLILKKASERYRVDDSDLPAALCSYQRKFAESLKHDTTLLFKYDEMLIKPFITGIELDKSVINALTMDLLNGDPNWTKPTVTGHVTHWNMYASPALWETILRKHNLWTDSSCEIPIVGHQSFGDIAPAGHPLLFIRYSLIAKNMTIFELEYRFLKAGELIACSTGNNCGTVLSTFSVAETVYDVTTSGMSTCINVREYFPEIMRSRIPQGCSNIQPGPNSTMNALVKHFTVDMDDVGTNLPRGRRNKSSCAKSGIFAGTERYSSIHDQGILAIMNETLDKLNDIAMESFETKPIPKKVSADNNGSPDAKAPKSKGKRKSSSKSTKGGCGSGGENKRRKKGSEAEVVLSIDDEITSSGFPDAEHPDETMTMMCADDFVDEGVVHGAVVPVGDGDAEEVALKEVEATVASYSTEHIRAPVDNLADRFKSAELQYLVMYLVASEFRSFDYIMHYIYHRIPKKWLNAKNVKFLISSLGARIGRMVVHEDDTFELLQGFTVPYLKIADNIIMGIFDTGYRFTSALHLGGPRAQLHMFIKIHIVCALDMCITKRVDTLQLQELWVLETTRAASLFEFDDLRVGYYCAKSCGVGAPMIFNGTHYVAAIMSKKPWQGTNSDTTMYPMNMSRLIYTTQYGVMNMITKRYQCSAPFSYCNTLFGNYFRPNERYEVPRDLFIALFNCVKPVRQSLQVYAGCRTVRSFRTVINRSNTYHEVGLTGPEYKSAKDDADWHIEMLLKHVGRAEPITLFSTLMFSGIPNDWLTRVCKTVDIDDLRSAAQFALLQYPRELVMVMLTRIYAPEETNVRRNFVHRCIEGIAKLGNRLPFWDEIPIETYHDLSVWLCKLKPHYGADFVKELMPSSFQNCTKYHNPAEMIAKIASARANVDAIVETHLKKKVPDVVREPHGYNLPASLDDVVRLASSTRVWIDRPITDHCNDMYDWLERFVWRIVVPQIDPEGRISEAADGVELVRSIVTFMITYNFVEDDMHLAAAFYASLAFLGNVQRRMLLSVGSSRSSKTTMVRAVGTLINLTEATIDLIDKPTDGPSPGLVATGTAQLVHQSEMNRMKGGVFKRVVDADQIIAARNLNENMMRMLSAYSACADSNTIPLITEIEGGMESVENRLAVLILMHRFVERLTFNQNPEEHIATGELPNKFDYSSTDHGERLRHTFIYMLLYMVTEEGVLKLSTFMSPKHHRNAKYVSVKNCFVERIRYITQLERTPGSNVNTAEVETILRDAIAANYLASGGKNLTEIVYTNTIERLIGKPSGPTLPGISISKEPRPLPDFM